MHDWSISPYATTLAVLGLVMVAAAWLPRLLAGRAITFPLLYVAAGAGLFALPLDLPRLEPLEVGTLTLHLTELVVIISLMSAGLKLDRAVSLRGWMTTWRLLAITMPLTIALIAGLGVWGLGWALPAAVLLGAVLAPTDPVLASEVQVESPEEDHEDQVRFSLTSEAGLNDGLAFPFTWLAIGLALHGGQAGDWAWQWFLVDVLYRIVVGFVGGLLVGWVLARLLFRPPKDGSEPVAQAIEGSLALAATFAAYGLVEMVSGYGFIAVFVAAYALRRHEMDHEAHVALHTFTEDIERVLMAVVLVLLGGAAWNVLGHLTWAGGGGRGSDRAGGPTRGGGGGAAVARRAVAGAAGDQLLRHPRDRVAVLPRLRADPRAVRRGQRGLGGDADGDPALGAGARPHGVAGDAAPRRAERQERPAGTD